MHTSVSLLLAKLTDLKESIQGLDYSRLIVDEIEDGLMAEDNGESKKKTSNNEDQEMMELEL